MSTYDGSEGTWEWTGGSDADGAGIINWDRDEPDGDDYYNCALLNAISGKLQDQSCEEESHGFICRVHPGGVCYEKYSMLRRGCCQMAQNVA